MENPDQNRVRDMRHNFDLTGADAAGKNLVPGAKPLRVKVFKSGNSLAVRMPKALGLEAGMELEIDVLPGGAIELRKVPPMKRKFDIDKVWGSATSLKPIDPDNRWFEERKLDWGNSASDEPA
jgi:antitoxin VapB